MKKTVLFFNFLILFFSFSWGQNLISIDASSVDTTVLSGHLKMGNAGRKENEILINSRYLTIGGKPILPVMGEVHFSRLPRRQWEDVILKMKACGVNIIATYIFWIHHEEVEGQWQWSDGKDFRAFVQLCQKHGLYVYPRIGPWCHGEVRNGGFPDWLMLKENIKTRSNDFLYQKYADELYHQIGNQMKGLLYKDGGPIIGVQLENEYTRGKGGEAHILWLKSEAIKYGIDVPMYTVTGWGNGSVPANEVVPLWGAYPDEPWASNLRRTTTCTDYEFSAYRNNEKIGNGLANKSNANVDKNQYPFLTCEMGVGIENTDHRRLVIGSLDGYGLIQAKLASGSNMIGYYMLAGGSNPQGIYSSMEESREDVGAYNTNPAVSYDFQAAIAESGKLNPSYFEVKKLHYFLNEFGDKLATMQPIIANTNSGLQLSVRANNNAAYLFGLNYCRHNVKPAVTGLQFKIQLKNETILFPKNPIDIPDSSTFIWPINFKMANTTLKYATAQPLCYLKGNRFNSWVFVQDVNGTPEFCFEANGIRKITCNKGQVSLEKGNIYVNNLIPGSDCEITITTKVGVIQKVIVLSKKEALQVWLLKNGDEKHLYLSDANMYLNHHTLRVFGVHNSMNIKVFGNDDLLKTTDGKILKPKTTSLFSNYQFTQPKVDIPVNYRKTNSMEGVQWLACSRGEPLTKNTELTHRFFIKRLILSDSSSIRSAKMLIASATPYKIKINSTWVNQEMEYGQLNEIDATGYLRKGMNQIMIDVPSTNTKNSIAAKLVVDFLNNNETQVVTDSTWLTKDQYIIPYLLSNTNGFKTPVIVDEKLGFNLDNPAYTTYSFNLPNEKAVSTLSNMYLNIKYAGDWIRMYDNGKLIGDDFNANTPWIIGLNRLPKDVLGNTVSLKILPLQKDKKIYFDQLPMEQDKFKAEILEIEIQPEYQFYFNLK